ncbi:hypothetical protein D3C72_2121320 [compost metagenome]
MHQRGQFLVSDAPVMAQHFDDCFVDPVQRWCGVWAVDLGIHTGSASLQTVGDAEYGTTFLGQRLYPH